MFTCLALAACGGGGGSASKSQKPQSPAGPAGQSQAASPAGNETGACAPSGSTLSVTAKDVKFDKSCLAAPAGQPFTIKFNNTDALPHNIAILKEHTSTDALFRGDIVTGPAMRDYTVNALPAGNYHFHCDVHPEMQGDFIVK